VDTAGFPDTARLIDLAPTILAAVGAPASVRRSGTVLQALVGEGAAVTAGAAVEGAIPGMGDLALNEDEAEEVEEHLRGLGYLE